MKNKSGWNIVWMNHRYGNLISWDLIQCAKNNSSSMLGYWNWKRKREEEGEGEGKGDWKVEWKEGKGEIKETEKRREEVKTFGIN